MVAPPRSTDLSELKKHRPNGGALFGVSCVCFGPSLRKLQTITRYRWYQQEGLTISEHMLTPFGTPRSYSNSPLAATSNTET